MTTITTPAGRVFRIETETLDTMEAVGHDAEEIDADIDQIVAGTLSLAGLTEACQDGAEDDATITAWQDYVTEVERHADRELLARQATA